MMRYDEEVCFEARCRITGLSYVGRSRYPPAEAWKRMVSQSRWGTKPIQVAIRDHGADSFDVTCILCADYRVIRDVARKRLIQLGPWPSSYNLPMSTADRRRLGNSPPAAEKELDHGPKGRLQEEGSATPSGE